MTAENKPEIIATTKRTWRLLDPKGPEFESFHELPAGSHRLEMRRSPYGVDETWFVLEGTQIGKPMENWMSFQDRADDFQVRIERSMPPHFKG